MTVRGEESTERKVRGEERTRRRIAEVAEGELRSVGSRVGIRVGAGGEMRWGG
jgi:hypothetical protein